MTDAEPALLQATFTPDRRVFLWSRTASLTDGLEELPGSERGQPARRTLALRAGRSARQAIDGVDLTADQAVRLLGALPADADVSDTVRCYSLAAKLALELAARKRVVPTVRRGNAEWIALLSHAADRQRFEALVGVLPPAGRLVPSTDRGGVKLRTARFVLRGFVDAMVDALYRRRAYPGPARGWALDLANALRGEEPAFAVRDARFQAMPGRIAAWASGADAPAPRIGFALELPTDGTEAQAAKGVGFTFPLRVVAHPPGDSRRLIPAAEAFIAGPEIEIDGQSLGRPAEAVVRGLARAGRVWGPLQRALAGARPADIQLAPEEAWSFLEQGRENLESHGFSLHLPEAFVEAGRQRIQARIRLGLPRQTRDGRLDLADLLAYRWEVLVGGQVLSREDFAQLASAGRPIVRWQGQWVFLDPAELARLPAEMNEEGRMKASDALRAVLCGTHDGVPVIADERLSEVIAALRDPPVLPNPPGLHGTLRGYQARGYAWLAALGTLGLGSLLADDMGLGKTIQLVSHLLGRAGEGMTSLVVCPTSVLGNWQREMKRFAPSLQVLRWHGSDRDGTELPEAEVVLTTYGILVRDADFLSRRNWDVVALDEAQSIKNPDSRRARAARRLQARHRVALTGTPVENRLDELWSVFEFLVPGLLGPRSRFHREVAVPVERFADEEAAATLRRTTAPFMLRRVKSDPTVAADLPDKLERREYAALTDEQRELYRAEVDAAMGEIAGTTEIERRGRVLAMLTALKQICNHPYHYLKRREPGSDDTLGGRSGKLDRVAEILETVAARGEHAVVFTQYREMGELLKTYLEGVLREPVPFLHGGTPATARDAMVRAFQSDGDVPTVLLVSLKAGGTGLTLTRATHVVHYDRWWNPAVEDQATDRAHRIGQERNVQVYKLVCEGTLEERIDALLDEKRELFDAVVGNGERWVTELDDDELRRLVVLAGDEGAT
ncbi:MAG: DEAD/DEAH box helicase [Alphaproteobacteria bacterium]|nr:DEAD/DEAH box helicase [Alphaproteobacteria bacterium]MCB9697048.1 DEAD/DEAH box helicase [Alphaproteobacteria bacterium]